MTLALVTGGAGFIGSHLVHALVAQGFAVRVLDNLSTGREHNLDGIDVHLIIGDIRQRESVAEAMQGVSVVYHQAAMISVPESITNPHLCYEVNVHGSLNILWAAHKARVRKVVLASSCAVYGEATSPGLETDNLTPLSPYAASKLAVEDMASLFSATYAVPTVCLRYFNVYGPGQDANSAYAAAIPQFITALLSGKQPTIFGDGSQTRDFVYVGDVVRANLLAGQDDKIANGTFNIAGSGGISILDMVENLREILPDAPQPKFGPARKGDILHSSADKRLALEALGYRPEIALEQGLQLTVQWFQSRTEAAT